MSAFAESQSVGELAVRAGQETPERRAMVSLYRREAELPDRLRMFFEGCPDQLSADRDPRAATRAPS